LKSKKGGYLGQKTNPIGNRLGIIKTWESRWFAKRDYQAVLHEDLSIRRFIKKSLYHAGVSRIEIERAGQSIKVIIHAARPGIIIGKKGAEVDRLKKELEDFSGKQVSIDIKEVRKPELDAQLVAENIALQLEKRVAFRKAMKKAVASALRFGALGVRVACAGRLAGAEIARTEWYREGRVPLHTFRADIDYGFAEAKTSYGRIGVKVWIYKGDILTNAPLQDTGTSSVTA
jgi:small subunit ribosomal protein S3